MTMIPGGVETGLRIGKMCGARPIRDLRRTIRRPWARRCDAGLVLDVIGIGIFWRPSIYYVTAPLDEP